ncbi:MAG: hypothetical protein IPF99_15485 [Deltaproteobacteria bacterium]|nr:hypothetical protein [Deltaproteobacteria bacterium]
MLLGAAPSTLAMPADRALRVKRRLALVTDPAAEAVRPLRDVQRDGQPAGGRSNLGGGRR